MVRLGHDSHSHAGGDVGTGTRVGTQPVLECGGDAGEVDTLGNGNGNGNGNGDGAGLIAGVAPLEAAAVRPIGATWLLDGLWRQLGVTAAVRVAVAAADADADADADARKFITTWNGCCSRWWPTVRCSR